MGQSRRNNHDQDGAESRDRAAEDDGHGRQRSCRDDGDVMDGSRLGLLVSLEVVLPELAEARVLGRHVRILICCWK